MLNYNTNTYCSSPPPLWLPHAITPEQVLRPHRSAQGWHGGTGSCPPLHSYQHPGFHINGKGILQSLKLKNFPPAVARRGLEAGVLRTKYDFID
jgi:hypothetical protein